MFSTTWVGTAALLVQLLLLASPSQSAPATYPLPSTEDPFYIAPKGFTETAPGTILRHRKLHGLSVNVTYQAVYQFLYRTTDSLGNPSAAVNTLVIPPNANFSQHMSHQLAYDESDPNCTPSYGLRLGANETEGEFQSIAGLSLAMGIPVSTSDYEGESAAFVCGPQAAHAVLDSVRAVLASGNITGMSPHAETVMFGYSGGSLATEWAAEYRASYARELKITGVAVGGVPYNMTNTFMAVNGTANAGLAIDFLQGYANGYPQFAHCMEDALVPSKAPALHAVSTTCNYDAMYTYQDVYSYFKHGIQFLYTSCWRHLINTAGILGHHGVPKSFPLYVFKGTVDEIVRPISDTDNYVKFLCDHGAIVSYYRYINQTHGGASAAGTPGALAFLWALLDGMPAPTACSTTNVPYMSA